MKSDLFRKIALMARMASCWILAFWMMAQSASAAANCSPTATKLMPVSIDQTTLSITVPSINTSSFEVQADGNYVMTNGVKDRSKTSYFGQWKNTEMQVVSGSAITLKGSGAVTLCTSTIDVNPAAEMPLSCTGAWGTCWQKGTVSTLMTKVSAMQPSAFLGLSVPALPQMTLTKTTWASNPGVIVQSFPCADNLSFYFSKDNFNSPSSLSVDLYQTEKTYPFNGNSVGFLRTDTGSASQLALPGDLGVIPWVPATHAQLQQYDLGGSCNVQVAQAACIARIDKIDGSTLAGALQIYVGQSPTGTDAAANSFYMTSTSQQFTSPQQGTIWLKINDPDNNYQNNTNHYNVTVTTGSVVDNGSVIDSFITPVKDTLDVVAQQMFIQSVKNSTFQNVVKTLVVLYVVITFLLFTLGLIEEPVQSFMIRTIKIGIVMYLVTNPNSYDFFYNHALGAFIHGRDELIKIVTGGNIADKDLFGFMDQMWSSYFNPTTGQYLQAYYFAVGDDSVSIVWTPFMGIITTIWVFALCYALYSYAYCIGVAIMAYMLSYTATALMLVIAPIFISFLLFDVTKKYFQEYFKYLFMFALQPVILFMMLTILNSLLLIMFAQAFNQPACSVCADAWRPLFAMMGLPGLAIYAVLQPVLCVNTYAIVFSNADIVPITMSVIAFLMMAHLMRHVVDFSASFTGFLTGTQEASGGLKLAVDPKKFLDQKSAGKEQGNATKLADKIKSAGR
jgi:type IV secretory pathway VirB6-like protein